MAAAAGQCLACTQIRISSITITAQVSILFIIGIFKKKHFFFVDDVILYIDSFTDVCD